MIPHFAMPFRIDGPNGAVVNDQDSEQEISDCVEAIVRYDQGRRPESPDFGLPDLTFSTPTVDEVHVEAYINRWEPRVQTTVGATVIDRLNPLIQEIQIGGNKSE